MDGINCGSVKFFQALPESIVGRNVFVVEDIVDTGTSLKALMPTILEKKPYSNGGDTKTGNVFRLCRYCSNSDVSSEFQQSLQACSRCKEAYYCSKECQKRDWKGHKPECTPFDKGFNKTLESGRHRNTNLPRRTT